MFYFHSKIYISIFSQYVSLSQPKFNKFQIMEPKLGISYHDTQYVQPKQNCSLPKQNQTQRTTIICTNIFFLPTSRFSERIIALKFSTTYPPVRAYDDAKSSNTKLFKNTEKYRKHKICYVCTCEWQGMVIPPSGHMICTAPIRITALSSPIMGYSNLPSYT